MEYRYSTPYHFEVGKSQIVGTARHALRALLRTGNVLEVYEPARHTGPYDFATLDLGPPASMPASPWRSEVLDFWWVYGLLQGVAPWRIAAALLACGGLVGAGALTLVRTRGPA
jgi:hypothetical protein